MTTSQDVNAHLRVAGRRLRAARLCLPPDPPRGSIEGVLARRIDELMIRLDAAMTTYADEERRAREHAPIEDRRRRL